MIRRSSSRLPAWLQMLRDRPAAAIAAVVAVLLLVALAVTLLRTPAAEEPAAPPAAGSPTPSASTVVAGLPADTDTTVSLVAVADTYADTAEPSKAPGGEPSLAVNPAAGTLLRFETKGRVPEGRILTGAVLRVFATAAEGAGVQPHPAGGTWQEAELAHANRPKPLAQRLGKPVLPATGQYTEIPVIDVSTVRLDAATAFELRAAEGAYAFDSREAAHPPQLTLTFTPKDENADSALPFDLPRERMDASAKQVFAHYFPPYPLSLDNADPGSDYYARNYLRPEGEGGKFAATGGLLRDRPLPRAPRGGNWGLADMETEVRQAKAAGLDGFTVDILNDNGQNWDRTVLLYDAAARVGGFRIVAMPDMNSLTDLDNAGMARMLGELARKPAAYKLGDGRLVVSPFKAENRNAAWWRETLSLLESRHGVRSAFVPTFLDWRSNADPFAGISHGFSNWGNRSPASNRTAARNAVDAHARGKLWMQPVSVQDVRPNQAIFDEAGNTENLRATWQVAIDGGAEWVQMVTWNDYSEGTSFAPSVGHGSTFLDVSSYYIARYKTGAAPKVRRDAVYLTHRKHAVGARPQVGSRLMTVRSDSLRPRDTVEVLSFLPRKATVTVQIGGRTHTYAAPAGMSARTFPLGTGKVSASVKRNGLTVAKAVSPFEVTGSPRVQNLEYVGVSSRR